METEARLCFDVLAECLQLGLGHARKQIGVGMNRNTVAPSHGVFSSLCEKGRLLVDRNSAGIGTGAALSCEWFFALLGLLSGKHLLSIDDGTVLVRRTVTVHQLAQSGHDLGTLGDLLTGNGYLAEPARQAFDLFAPARRHHHGGSADGELGHEPIHADQSASLSSGIKRRSHVAWIDRYNGHPCPSAETPPYLIVSATADDLVVANAGSVENGEDGVEITIAGHVAPAPCRRRQHRARAR